MTENHDERFVPDEMPADEMPANEMPANEMPADEPEPASGIAPDEPAVRTGHEAVDRVLESLDALADAPLAEHVTVFEEAHDRLRGTLAGAGDTSPQA